VTSDLILLPQTQPEACEGHSSTFCNTLHNTSVIRSLPTHVRTGGIDALALRVQNAVPFTKDFCALLTDIRRRRGATKRSLNYHSEIDLRPYSISAILHETRYGNPHGEHKLELKDVGKMSAAEMRREIAEVFDIDPDSLAVMRVDLYADTEVPMGWYQTHAYVKRKRSVRTYGKADVETSVKNNIKTITLGAGTNMFRLYDKAAMWRQEYSEAVDRMKEVGGDISSFIRTYGREKADVVTRVEQQLRGGSVPAQLCTVGSLFEDAAEFDPFKSLVLLSGGQPEPDAYTYTLNGYLCGMGARQYIEAHGLAEFRTMVNSLSKNNAAKVFRRVQDFIPSDAEGFTAPNLTALYQWGVRRQIAGSTFVPTLIATA